MIRIALDGPSGAGKSTLAKAVANHLGIVYLDTGALYRTIGLHVKMNGVSPDDEAAVAAILPTADIDVKIENGTQEVYLNGEAVGERIRTPEMSEYASKTSAMPPVRAFLLDKQREIARKNSVIMDGRDIGSVVLPDAEVKVFLTASAETRAMRRLRDHMEKGINITYEEVLADMRERDHRDSTRAIAPLKKAEDAIEFDNSDYTFEESLRRLLEIIEDRMKSCGLEVS